MENEASTEWYGALGSWFIFISKKWSQNEPNDLSTLECFVFKINRTILMNSSLWRGEFVPGSVCLSWFDTLHSSESPGREWAGGSSATGAYLKVLLIPPTYCTTGVQHSRFEVRLRTPPPPPTWIHSTPDVAYPLRKELASSVWGYVIASGDLAKAVK